MAIQRIVRQTKIYTIETPRSNIYEFLYLLNSDKVAEPIDEHTNAENVFRAHPINDQKLDTEIHQDESVYGAPISLPGLSNHHNHVLVSHRVLKA